MHTFFHGWRRKAGCVTLAMALFLWCLWVRSTATTDYIACRLPDWGIPFLVFRSHQGEIGWQDLSMFPTYVPVGWTSNPFTAQDQALEEFRLAFVTLPYWRLVIPLTLISVYLVLWKPRQTPKPADPRGPR